MSVNKEIEATSEEIMSDLLKKIEKEEITVSVRPLTMPVQSYYSDYIKRKKIVTDVDFQRRYVWDEETASRFIESLYLGLPIPPIMLVKVKAKDTPLHLREKFIVVDGMQRTNTIVRFIENELRLRSVLDSLNEKRYSDLLDYERSKIENYSLNFYEIEIRSETFRDCFLTMVEIFKRLNLGSKRLTFNEVILSSTPTMIVDIIKCISDEELCRKIQERTLYWSEVDEKTIYEILREVEKIRNLFRNIFKPSEGEKRKMYDRIWIALIMLIIYKKIYEKSARDNIIPIKNWKRELAEFVIKKIDKDTLLRLLREMHSLLECTLKMGIQERKGLRMADYRKSKSHSIVPWFVIVLFSVIYEYVYKTNACDKCNIDNIIVSLKPEMSKIENYETIRRAGSGSTKAMEEIAKLIANTFENVCIK
jgi:hypothetical protein